MVNYSSAKKKKLSVSKISDTSSDFDSEEINQKPTEPEIKMETPNGKNLSQNNPSRYNRESDSSEESISEEKPHHAAPINIITNSTPFKSNLAKNTSFNKNQISETSSDSECSLNYLKSEVSLKKISNEPEKSQIALTSTVSDDESSFSDTNPAKTVSSNPKLLQQNKKPLIVHSSKDNKSNIDQQKHNITPSSSTGFRSQKTMAGTKLEIPIIKKEIRNNIAKPSDTLKSGKNRASKKLVTSKSKIDKNDIKRLAENDSESSGSDSQLEEEVNDILAIIDFNRRTSKCSDSKKLHKTSALNSKNQPSKKVSNAASLGSTQSKSCSLGGNHHKSNKEPENVFSKSNCNPNINLTPIQTLDSETKQNFVESKTKPRATYKLEKLVKKQPQNLKKVESDSTETSSTDDDNVHAVIEKVGAKNPLSKKVLPNKLDAKSIDAIISNSVDSSESSSTTEESDKKPLNQPKNDSIVMLDASKNKKNEILASSSHENSENEIQPSKLPKSQIFTSKIYKKMKKTITDTSFKDKKDLQKILQDQNSEQDSSDLELSEQKIPISIAPSINNKQKHVSELAIDVPPKEKISASQLSGPTKRKLHNKNVVLQSKSSTEDSDSSIILASQSSNHFYEKIHKNSHGKTELPKISSNEVPQKELKNQIHSKPQTFFSPTKNISNFTVTPLSSVVNMVNQKTEYNNSLKKHFQNKPVNNIQRERLAVVHDQHLKSSERFDPTEDINETSKSTNLSKSIASQNLVSQKFNPASKKLDVKSIPTLKDTETSLEKSTSFDSNDLNKPEKLMMIHGKKGLMEPKELQKVSNGAKNKTEPYEPADNQTNKRKKKGKGQKENLKKTNKFSQEISGQYTSTPLSIADIRKNSMDFLTGVIESKSKPEFESKPQLPLGSILENKIKIKGNTVKIQKPVIESPGAKIKAKRRGKNN